VQFKFVLHQIRIQAIIYLFLIFLFLVPADGQTKDEEVFTQVPVSLRSRLAERLKLLTKYQRTQHWEKQYKLLSVLFTQGNSKEEFVKLNRDWYVKGSGNLILDFIPKSVVAHNESSDYGEWTIYGCAKVREKKRAVWLYASVDAHREKGDWFFSQVGVITPIDGKASPCP